MRGLRTARGPRFGSSASRGLPKPSSHQFSWRIVCRCEDLRKRRCPLAHGVLVEAWAGGPGPRRRSAIPDAVAILPACWRHAEHWRLSRTRALLFAELTVEERAPHLRELRCGTARYAPRHPTTMPSTSTTSSSPTTTLGPEAPATRRKTPSQATVLCRVCTYERFENGALPRLAVDRWVRAREVSLSQARSRRGSAGR